MNTETGRHPGLNLGSGHAEAHGEAEALVFGFWVFMMSDLVTFGLLLATYVTMLDNLAAGPGPKDLFELKPVFIETLVLLTSSLTYGMAILSLKASIWRAFRRSRATRSSCLSLGASNRLSASCVPIPEREIMRGPFPAVPRGRPAAAAATRPRI